MSTSTQAVADRIAADVLARRGGRAAADIRALRLDPPADGDWTRAAVDAVREISGALGVKQPLRELGVRPDLLRPIAAGAVADAATGNTPRQPTEEEVLRILEAVY
ncbi:hypothetical protein ACWC6I_40435 [Streptomyces sp. NPDC001414]